MERCVVSPDHLKEERYEELSALAAIGELSAAEFAELNEHLAGCGSCRTLYFDFCGIASRDLGAVAAGRRVSDAAVDLDLPALLESLLQRAQSEAGLHSQADAVGVPHHCSKSTVIVTLSNLVRGPMLVLAAVILLCAAVGIGAYQLRDRQLSPPRNQLNPQSSVHQRDAEALAAPARAPSALLQPSLSDREALQKSLAEARRGYSDLLKQRKALEAELATTKDLEARREQERQEADKAIQRSEESVKNLEARLQDALLRSQEQAGLLDQFKARLQRAEQNVPRATTRETPEADAKDIFGARDLHMVDVYDVDASGKTKRTFGRVYFVEKKLLLFYAFDLQDKQPQRIAAAFQAWGYRQGNEDKPQNLGLFLMDDPALSRWVLKVSNARVLDHVDAVFVTLEPPNGSSSPRGRRLLYANLGGPPNHP